MKKYINVFIKAIGAGIAIGIGGTVYLSCNDRYIGSFLFGIGLFIILNYGYNLYTGKIGYLADSLKDTGASYLIDIFLIWLGNFAGTAITAVLISQTRVRGLQEKAKLLCDTKMRDDILSLFVLALFCGALMFIAAEGFKKCDNSLGRNIATFLPVAVFILCGFEHCVADMYYFALAGCWSGKMWLALITITAGNTIGGITLRQMTK